MANRTRTQLSSDSSTLFPDNTSQLISPLDLRDWLTNGIDSFVTQKDVSSFENAIYEAKGSSLTAGATVDLSTATGNYLHITGAATISNFGTVQAGAKFLLVFDGICTLTYNATSLIIPGGTNKTTAAGDACLIVSEGSGNWKIAGYFNISGSGGGSGTITGVTAGTGLSGGGTSGAVTLNLANTAVTPDSYTNANITVDAQGRITSASNGTTSGTVTSVSGTAPIQSSGGNTPSISIPKATGSVDGYLSSTDWTTFNSKGNGTVTSVSGTAPIQSSGGNTPAISIPKATGSVDGYLSSTDWTTFNNKQGALSAGTGISLASNTITNTAPDQTVVLTAGTGIGVSGTYPSFTITNAGGIPTSTVQHQVKLGENISKGQAVYVSSANGTNMIVSKASNATEATSSKTMGLIDATGVTNDFVNVVTEGLLAGLDTSAANAAGDPVWLGTSGNLLFGLANKPYAPAHMVSIGIVTRKSATNGEIFVKVQNGFELDELHNVQAQTPSLNDVLYYDNSVSPAQWKTTQITSIATAASASASGIVTTSAQTFSGIKTFGNSTSAGEIRLLEPSGSGSNYVAVKSQALAADYSLTLPINAGVSGQVLQTDGSGLLSWVNQTPSSGISRVNATTTGTTITGTTAKTKTLSVLIPANTFGAGTILQVSAFGIRTAGTTNGTMRIEVNTSDAIGGTLLATYTYLSVATNSWFKLYREFIISNSTTDTSGFPGATSAVTDTSAVVASIGSNAIDWTVNQYVVVSMQNGNAADSTYCRAISILQK